MNERSGIDHRARLIPAFFLQSEDDNRCFRLAVLIAQQQASPVRRSPGGYCFDSDDVVCFSARPGVLLQHR